MLKRPVNPPVPTEFERWRQTVAAAGRLIPGARDVPLPGYHHARPTPRAAWCSTAKDVAQSERPSRGELKAPGPIGPLVATRLASSDARSVSVEPVDKGGGPPGPVVGAPWRRPGRRPRPSSP